jgi:hypothetical protein
MERMTLNSSVNPRSPKVKFWYPVVICKKEDHKQSSMRLRGLNSARGLGHAIGVHWLTWQKGSGVGAGVAATKGVGAGEGEEEDIFACGFRAVDVRRDVFAEGMSWSDGSKALTQDVRYCIEPPTSPNPPLARLKTPSTQLGPAVRERSSSPLSRREQDCLVLLSRAAFQRDEIQQPETPKRGTPFSAGVAKASYIPDILTAGSYGVSFERPSL